MKSILNENPAIPDLPEFPCLMRLCTGGESTIILFTSAREGVVVYFPGNKNRLGYRVDYLDIGKFRRYDGTVRLSND